eukprot:gb/GEZN01023872.1/.p1 GENE.gb/GEZN01023872.1/~~gb/GEZN01023872.1/.p1  ORF type:complete len:168 (-),score=19.99 gb/GEZN01023872.1/:59-562(-)
MADETEVPVADEEEEETVVAPVTATDSKVVVPSETKSEAKGVEDITSGLGSMSVSGSGLDAVAASVSPPRPGSGSSSRRETKVMGPCWVGLSKIGWLATVQRERGSDPTFDYYEAVVLQNAWPSASAKWYVVKRSERYFVYPSYYNLKNHGDGGVNPTLLKEATYVR